MTDGLLRREVAERFGDFFTERAFGEMNYHYDQEAFGNEILELSAPDGLAIRFVRDRSQVFADLRRKPSRYVGTHLLFAQLGVDCSEHARIDQQGLLKPLARDLMKYWDALVALL